VPHESDFPSQTVPTRFNEAKLTLPVALIAKPTNKAKEETEMCGEAKRVHSQGDINSVETA
jgi:hypothetical protein